MTIQLAEQALSCYQLPSGTTARLVSRSENETYKIEAPSGERWALRVLRPGYQSHDSLASEIAWLHALREDGVGATSVPIAGCNSEWIQTVGARKVVLFAWEAGCAPHMGMDLRQPMRSLGALAARMHAHSRTWHKPQNFERFRWDFSAALGEGARWGDWRNGLGMDAARLDLFGRTVELIRIRLVKYGTGPDRFGLAHCDLRLDNLLLEQGRVKAIDFDDCGFSWYMYDAATVVSFYEHLPETKALLEEFLRGYRTVRAVSKEEEDELPTFVMMRRLLLVAWIASHPHAELARELGVSFTDQTVGLCDAYLRSFA